MITWTIPERRVSEQVDEDKRPSKQSENVAGFPRQRNIYKFTGNSGVSTTPQFMQSNCANSGGKIYGKHVMFGL